MNFTKDELSKLSHAINWVITDAVQYVSDLERDISWQWFGIKNQQQEEKTLKSSEITELMDLGVHFDDVDGFVEFKGKLFIFWELKLGKTPLPKGQQWGLERLCDAVEKSGAPCYFLVVRHNVEDTSEDIDVSQAIVSDVRYKGEWRQPGIEMNLKQVIDLLRSKHVV